MEDRINNWRPPQSARLCDRKHRILLAFMLVLPGYGPNENIQRGFAISSNTSANKRS